MSLTLTAYRAAERLAGWVPAAALPALARLTGTVAWAAMRGRRRMVGRHLERVTDGPLASAERRRRERGTFASYAAYWIDTFRLRGTSPAELDRRLTAEGLDRLDAALERGRGALLATAHLGSWDLGGAWLAGRGYPLTVVVERLRPPELLDWFAKVRTDLGMQVVVKGRDVWEQLEAALRQNRLVVLVSDRDLRGKGVEVCFFGETTTLPVGPARLARTCAVPILPVAVYDRGGGCHHGVVFEEIAADTDDIEVTTQHLADALERMICRAPEQWHLLQPNWPSDWNV